MPNAYAMLQPIDVRPLEGDAGRGEEDFAERHKRGSAMMEKFCNWWVSWSPLIIGLTWIFMAIVCLGRGETYGIFVSFFGMLWWATQEQDIRALRRDFRQALDGWSETISAWDAATKRSPPGDNSRG